MVNQKRAHGGTVKAKGKIFLSNVRMVFVADKPTQIFTAFDMPLLYVHDEKFHQPVFHCNNISGVVEPVVPYDQNRAMYPAHSFKIMFKNGGCGTFVPLFLNLIKSVRQYNQQFVASNTTYVDPLRAAQTPVGDMMNCASEATDHRMKNRSNSVLGNVFNVLIMGDVVLIGVKVIGFEGELIWFISATYLIISFNGIKSRYMLFEAEYHEEIDRSTSLAVLQLDISDNITTCYCDYSCCILKPRIGASYSDVSFIAEADGFSSVHGGFGYGVRNEEGRTILEFAAAHDLVVVNSFFKKRDAHLITYHSGDHNTQIDYMLVRKGDLRVCKDCKVFLGEVCFSQHRLLALDIHIKRRPCSTKMVVKLRILWKNLHGKATEAFRARVTKGVTPEVEGRTVADAEQTWNKLANTIREATKETIGVVAGTSRTHIGRRESWWLTEEVQNKVKAKQTRFRELISMRGDEANKSAIHERYKEAKREVKKAIARAKVKAHEDLYKRLDSKEGENDIYRIAKARDRRKMDLGSVRFIKDEDGRSIVNEDAIRRRWNEYFFALFNGQRHCGKLEGG
ncbi:stress-induced protein [Tanacetum coccineum]|uniref:Stress-induced protein n=1 Tax=Tanacetum coccineum TaxID=301880 RepID=A0ABQ5AEL0_9ASTR